MAYRTTERVWNGNSVSILERFQGLHLPFMLITALILICMLSAPAQGSTPTVIIEDYRVSPSVLLPGDTGTITVILKNTAQTSTLTVSDTFTRPEQNTVSTTSTDINAYVESAYLYGNGIDVIEGSFQDIGALGPGQSLPLTFLIQAPQSEGIYFPEVWVRVAGATSVKYPIPVNVNSQYALLKNPSLRVERTVPASVEPGDPFNITLFLLNEGEGSANDISVKVNSTSRSITPMTSENYYIPQLQPGEQKVLNLSFETDTDAPLGLEPILVTLDYLNANLSSFQQASTIGVPIVGRAALGIASVTTDPVRITAGDPVDLTIRIENTGTADANSAQARIDDLPLPGTKQAFMGTIEPNNDAPAVFSLQADQAGEFEYNLTILFTDDYGTHTTQQSLRMIVAERDATGLIIVAVVVIAAVLVIAFVYYRRRKES